MSETLSSELTRLLNETLNQAAEAPSETRDSWESHRAALIYEAARVFRRCLNDIGHQGQVEDVPAGETEPGESADERLWDLTKLATAVGAREDVRGALDQAVAALQVASCVFASPGADISTRIDELRSVQRGLQQQVRVHANGPYIVTNVDTLTTWLGESYPNTPRMSLCRCGGSASKPFCDGTHARKPFDDGKDPKRLPDRQNTYVGQQVTILDNRGTCAHSGFCTDRLSSVFHLKEDPFITPSGARMDEIVRAVRDCPSGALSLAIDGREARDTVDTVRKRSIEVSRDGPYRVTGGIPLVDDKGVSVTRNAGASLEHYSLCRCGHSQNKPFCSGMHWYVRFQDPVSSPDHQPTLFEWVGGLPALTRMTRLFYSKLVPEDPPIGPLFAKMSPDHPERVAAWLSEVFGGRKVYSTHYGGYTRMVSQHLGKGLMEPQRARWVSLMIQSADEAGIPRDPEFRAAFVAYLEWGSRLALENSQPGAHPPPNMPVPRWWWVYNATPGSRVSALQPAPERAADSAPMPKPDESVSFAVHVKPLFRSVDRQSMLLVFDLWAFTDVVKHAADILLRLESGSMPCDGAWPKSQVDTFRRWIELGMPA